MKTKFPWIKRRKKTAPELAVEPPIWMRNRSNGEYFHQQTPYEKRLREFTLKKADENARRLGVDRREFMASSLGMATTLWCINVASGCSSDSSSGSAGGNLRPDGGGNGMNGGGAEGGAGPICVPEEAMYDEDVACSVVGGDEFIFDVQTHWFSEEDTQRFPPEVLGIFGPLFQVANEDAYVRDMFLGSDTTMAVLTSWPGTFCPEDPNAEQFCGLPLSNESMVRSRDRINQMACNTQRVIQHMQLLPNDPNLGLEQQMDLMTQLHCENMVHGWKMYPGFASSSIDPQRGSAGYFLDQRVPRKIIEHGLDLGVTRFCVHKGLPIGAFFEKEHNYPREIGIVARDYPGAQFIIYHSGICSGFDNCNAAPAEGPYDPDEANPTGVNALIRSLLDNGVKPNENVYAEVGSAINELQADPVAAAHFFGKLMKFVGVDNVVWGTDCVIYGSPQPFIEWFRALTIPEDMQRQYGYPPLDATNKAKIFGLNAAALYGVDIDMLRCQVDSCQTSQIKRELDAEYGPRRWSFQAPGGPRTWREYVEHTKLCAAKGRPG